MQKQIQFLEEVLETLNYDLEVRQYQSAHCLELSNSGQMDGELWRIEGGRHSGFYQYFLRPYQAPVVK